MAVALLVGAYMDSRYDVTPDIWCPIRAYVFSFPVGLIDYYFAAPSVTLRHIPVLVGTIWWGYATTTARFHLSRWLLGGNEGDQSTDTTSPLQLAGHDVGLAASDSGGIHLAAAFGTEFLRFLVNVVLIGVLSDLFFSPSHRLTHKFLYDKQHSIHHRYHPHELTTLVVYYAGAMDNFLMGGSITLGGILCDLFLLRYPLLKSSNVTLQLVIYNTLFSHAHDIRANDLLLPFLPSGLNFAAYHRVHHQFPHRNFGFTFLTDGLWDLAFRETTVLLPSSSIVVSKHGKDTAA
jgi:hypothetical protein